MNGYCKLRRSVWDDMKRHRITRLEFDILTAIACEAGPPEFLARFTAADLANIFGENAATVRTALSKLRDRGMVVYSTTHTGKSSFALTDAVIDNPPATQPTTLQQPSLQPDQQPDQQPESRLVKALRIIPKQPDQQHDQQPNPQPSSNPTHNPPATPSPTFNGTRENGDLRQETGDSRQRKNKDMPRAAALRVFDFYVSSLKRAKEYKATEDRIGKILTRLRDFTEDELKTAVLGLSRSKHHLENGYTDLMYAVRSTAQTQLMIDLATKQGALIKPVAASTCSCKRTTLRERHEVNVTAYGQAQCMACRGLIRKDDPDYARYGQGRSA